MTSGNYLWVLALMLFAFVMGIQAGAWLEARLWRGKAISGFRMESAGKLYVVRDDE